METKGTLAGVAMAVALLSACGETNLGDQKPAITQSAPPPAPTTVTAPPASPPAVPAPVPADRLGLAGDDVRMAQATLRERGLYRGAIDGIAGPATKAAVAHYQRRNGMATSGRLDGQTMARLESDHAGYGASGTTARRLPYQTGTGR